MLTVSSGEITPANPYKLGWKPKWDEERYLASLDDEVDAALEPGVIKSTIFDSVLEKPE